MSKIFEYTHPDGTTESLEQIDRDDWTSLSDPCPNCGGTEFNQYSAEGCHLGRRNGTVVRRTDYEATKTPLATRCRSCRTILHKHPIVDALDQIPLGDN
jgi:hypothetical protein